MRGGSCHSRAPQTPASHLWAVGEQGHAHPTCPVVTVLSLVPSHPQGNTSPAIGAIPASFHPSPSWVGPVPGATLCPILTCALTGRAGARGRAGLGAVGFEADSQDVLSRLRRSGTEDAADRGDMEEAGGNTAGRGSGLWAEGTVTSSDCCPPESPPAATLPAVKVKATRRRS